MSYALAYWILIFLWVIFGIGPQFPGWPSNPYWGFGGSLLTLILFILLGLHDFGSALHP